MVEERLHRGLVDAASVAPVFRGLRRRPTRNRRRILTASFGAVVAAATCASLWFAVTRQAPTDEDGGGGDASCAATMTFRDSKYWAHGGQLRTPRPGRHLGSGNLPPCEGENGDAVDVLAFPGVSPHIAVIANGSVWIEDATFGSPLPRQIAELETPVKCRHEGAKTVLGTWTSYRGPTASEGTAFTPPYIAVVNATAGEGLPLDRYTSVTIDVQVSASTSGGTDREMAGHALYEGAPIQLSVECVDDRFSARSIGLSAED